MDRDRYRPELVVWNFHSDDTYVHSFQQIGVPLHSFPERRSAIGKLLALRRMVHQKRPDVIHSHTFYTNFAAWWACLGMKTIAVGAVRSNFTNDKKACGFLLGSLSARWPYAQIYNNLAGAEKARRSHGLFAPRQVFVVRNGLDLKQFGKSPLSANGRARIVGVGSLLQYKRWDRLLGAAAKLKKRGLDFLVEIAGGGPLRESLEHQVHDLDLEDRIKFRGHTDNVPALLADSTLLAHTSDIEGCPNVVMEAMACGRAVVATDAGDVPSIVEDGRTGFVVPRGDDAKLCERLDWTVWSQEPSRHIEQPVGGPNISKDLTTDRFELAAQLVGYSSAARYKTRGELLFNGIRLADAHVLEVGCGTGAWAIWAALHGANRVVGIEPEAQGSTSNVLSTLRKSIEILELNEKITASSHYLHQLPVQKHAFDVVVMYNVINHLDESAVVSLHREHDALSRYVSILENLRLGMHPDSWVIVADCARTNLWNQVGLVSPFARSIEWHKHQNPPVWTDVFERAGYDYFDLRWQPLQPFPRLTANWFAQYLTCSLFVLRFRAT
jgi:glycosyltransferase involved in cell wall biosynthesis